MQYFKNQFQFKLFDFIGFLVLGFIIFTCGQNELNEQKQKKDPGVYDVSILVDDMQRWFKVIIPSQYDHTEERPLLLVFHGGNNSMGSFFNKRKDIIERCELENWILIFANGSNGFTNKGSSTWNAIHCCDPSLKHNVDEISFVRKMIDTMDMELKIDLDRIYALGGSNGGMLVHRIAGELSDIIAAAATNQATIGGKINRTSPELMVQAKSNMPMIMIHGLSDQQVKYKGGKTLESERIDFSFNRSIQFWVDHNTCNTSKVDSSLVQGLKGRVWIEDYSDCASDTKVRAITIENRGHGWPSLEKSGFDGTNASIDFLKEFSK